MEIIPVSSNNIKLTSSLSYKKYRDQSGKFLVEGQKCSKELMGSNLTVDFIVVANSLKNIDYYLEISRTKNIPIYLADEHTFKKMSDAKSPQGVICVASIPKAIINSNSSFIYLESISDPGNLGTIIRTADWFGISNLLLSKDSVDSYNPKVVRSTMGSLFRMNVIYIEDALNNIEDIFPSIPYFAADVNSEMNIKDISPPQKFGLLFGSEARGFSEKTLNNIKNTFKIQGDNQTESLNLSVSVGISIFHFITGK